MNNINTAIALSDSKFCAASIDTPDKQFIGAQQMPFQHTSVRTSCSGQRHDLIRMNGLLTESCNMICKNEAIFVDSRKKYSNLVMVIVHRYTLTIY